MIYTCVVIAYLATFLEFCLPKIDATTTKIVGPCGIRWSGSGSYGRGAVYKPPTNLPIVSIPGVYLFVRFLYYVIRLLLYRS